VESGACIAIESGLTVGRELASGVLVALESDDLEIRRDLHLVELRGVTRSPVAARFVELLGATPRRPKQASRKQ